MNDDLDDRLESWGRSPAPEVDGAFANRLETDLRAGGADSATRGFRPGALLRPGFVVAALILIVGVVVVLRRDTEPVVQMVAADGTTVSIPGAAATRAGAAGLELPEGSRIIVGPEGSAVVAGVVLEAGSTALITDGRVDVVEAGAVRDVEAPDATPPTTTPTTSVAPTTTAPAATDDIAPTTIPPTTDRPVTDEPSESTTSTTVADDTVRTTTTTVVPDSIPSTTEPGTTVPPTTKPPADEPVDPPPVDVAPLRVALEIGPVRNGQATLQWTTTGDTTDVAGWIVRIKRGDSSEIIALLREPDARRLRVAIPDREVQFRVVARDGAGEVLAASRLVGVRR